MIFAIGKQCKYFSDRNIETVVLQRNGQMKLHEIMRYKMTLYKMLNHHCFSSGANYFLQVETGTGGAGMKTSNFYTSLPLAVNYIIEK
jgi:hypothetical protein